MTAVWIGLGVLAWVVVARVVGGGIGQIARRGDEAIGITQDMQDAQQAAQLDRADPRAGDRSWW